VLLLLLLLLLLRLVTDIMEVLDGLILACYRGYLNRVIHLVIIPFEEVEIGRFLFDTEHIFLIFLVKYTRNLTVSGGTLHPDESIIKETVLLCLGIGIYILTAVVHNIDYT
jgi:hypothetical protein